MMHHVIYLFIFTIATIKILLVMLISDQFVLDPLTFVFVFTFSLIRTHF